MSPRRNRNAGAETSSSRADPGWSLVFVSDLHMSSGHAASTGARAAHEHFHQDESFARFLTALARRAAHDERIHLVLLGDTFDFVDAALDDAAGRGLDDTSAVTSERRLEQMLAGHEVVVTALAELVSVGGRVTIVAGNHDPEIIRTSLQERLRAALTRVGTARGTAGSVDFQPWIFFLPGIVYAEHGQQYHDLNALITPVTPHPRARDQITLPVGSSLAAYRSVNGSRTSRIGLAAEVTRGLLARWDPRRQRLRAAYRNDTLRRHAADAGLPWHVLAELDELAAVSALGLERRVARALAGRLLREADTTAWDVRGCLRRAVVSIDTVLRANALAVPYYVLGHTHVPEDVAFGVGEGRPRYLNSGTWSDLHPPTATRLTFVEISGATGKPAEARVLRWNDADRTSEPCSADP